MATQFMFITTDGRLWHTVRNDDGTWTGQGDVGGVLGGIPGRVTAVAGTTSNVIGETEWMFTTDDGRLWHTLRHGDGTWTGLGSVNGAIPGGITGQVIAVGAAQDNIVLR